VLKSPHPSPLSASRGFFGNRHFSRANAYLIETGQQPIDWQLPESAVIMQEREDIESVHENEGVHE